VKAEWNRQDAEDAREYTAEKDPQDPKESES
jgi:hypothetical protein